MTEEDKKARDIEDAMAKHDAAKKDAAEAGEKLDKVLSCLDAMSKRMDGFESMMDAAKRKDAEGEIEEKGDPKEMSVDAEGAAHAPDQPA